MWARGYVRVLSCPRLRVSRAAVAYLSVAAPSPASPVSSPGSFLSSKRWRCYRQLSKTRLSMLVAASASAGCLAAGSPINFFALTSVTAGTFLTAACANTFNQIIERDSDALMKRTCLRPLPSLRMSCLSAAKFGVSTGVSGLALLYAGTNPLTASLAAANILFYTCLYTPLKKVTPFNTEVGSVVGAIPPMMGWAAATGTITGAEPLVLGSILFLWQMPHFLSLAHILRRDYTAGGYRMLSHLDNSGSKTSRSSMVYTGLLAPLPVLTTLTGMTSTMFAIDGLAVNAFFLMKAYRFYSNPSDSSARELFKTSLWHLPVLLTLFAFHKTKDDAGVALDVPALHVIGRTLCPHESLVLQSDGNTCNYCPINLELQPPPLSIQHSEESPLIQSS